MRVLVCGSRDYSDLAVMDLELHRIHRLHQITLLIEGGAKGADTWAHRWCECNGVPNKTYPANWERYGKAAGPIRNKQMLDEGKPDLVVAFPLNGNLDATKGTKNMVKQARERGIATIVVTKTTED